MVLEVFVHPGCASERAAREVAHDMQILVPDLCVQIRSIIQERERAEQLGVMVVPAFVLDGRLLSVGVPRKEWLLAKLQNQEEAPNRSETGII